MKINIFSPELDFSEGIVSEYSQYTLVAIHLSNRHDACATLNVIEL